MADILSHGKVVGNVVNSSTAPITGMYYYSIEDDTDDIYKVTTTSMICPICNELKECEVNTSLWSFSITYRLPCGHGEYRQDRAGSSIMEWASIDVIKSERAWEVWNSKEPEMPEWSPPSLSMKCACGKELVLKGYHNYDDDREGWLGGCAECGMVIEVYEGGRIGKKYVKKRERMYNKEMRNWKSKEPKRLDGVTTVAMPIVKRVSRNECIWEI